MNILGISAFYHDSAAALIMDGKIISAAQEERFSRIKFDASFPLKAIQYCLQEAGLSLSELDLVVFYDKPWLKFERLLESYLHFAPKGFASFLTSMPVWLKDKIFLKDILVRELKLLGEFNRKRTKLLFSEHHLSHAASTFFCSPFEEALILTLDGVGEWATASIGYGKGNKIQVFKELHFPHSLGLLYSSFTYYLGFRVNSGEYKLMGLAPFGAKGSAEVERFKSIIKSTLVNIKDDGSIRLNQKWFSYAYGLRMVNDKKWQLLFGIKKREKDAVIDFQHANLALAIQEVTEEIILKMLRHAKSLLPGTNTSLKLCLAGGVALNCVANGKILKEHLFEDIYIQPAAGDAGGAIGAALAGWHIYLDQPRAPEPYIDLMQGAFLGPGYDDREIAKMASKYHAVYRREGSFDVLSRECGVLISAGKVLGWFQGRMEFGPRALGNRSILGDPRNPEMQKKMNLKIKFREGFRPFAPAVLVEQTAEYFDPEVKSPYMLLVSNLKKDRRIEPEVIVPGQTILDRLYQIRSDIPAVTHVDYSARLQTVDKDSNPRFYQLLQTFRDITGCGVLINTSFNVRGEPIVCSPEDAYRCFMRSEMDILVIENYIFEKENQPPWHEADWKRELLND